MTRRDESRAPGYRGALATREDRLARPWVVTVIVAFLLIIVLSVLGVPSRFVPEPTPIPLPTIELPTPTSEASPSAPASEAASPEVSESPPASASDSPSP